MKRAVIFLMLLVLVFGMVGCGTTQAAASDGNAESTAPDKEIKPTNKEIELTDEEMTRLKTIFKEYVGEELKYKPKYNGEWLNGNQFVTENYAYGQYLINMDMDGYVHLVVWVGDKGGEFSRTVVYNRLEDESAIPETPNDGAIHLVAGVEGEYGTTVRGYIHYKVPAGTYTVVNEAKRAVVFVVADNDPNDERAYVPMKEGESAEIKVDADAHIELSGSSVVALTPKNDK